VTLEEPWEMRLFLMPKILLLSFALGFVTASPIGPIGLLCLRRALTRGGSAGIISAVGIACAYAFWSFVAVHGLRSVSDWIAQERELLQVAIGLFFVLLGLHGIFNTPTTNYPRLQNNSAMTQFGSTFFVVFLNPMTFSMFSVLFTLLGLVRTHFDFDCNRSDPLTKSEAI
jgi:threonine/homoserine/homoserine lactone efflux protein